MLYDFHEHIESLRQNEERKKTVEEYEALFGKITGDIETQIWYSEYVRRFVEEAPQIAIPEDLTEDFNWPLLVGLVVSSFSTNKYEFIYPAKECVRAKEEAACLKITVRSEGQTITKAIDDLWAFQILRLFEIYVEEQMTSQTIIAGKDKEEALSMLKSREQQYEEFSSALLYPSYSGHVQRPKKKRKTTQMLEPELLPKPPKVIYHYTSFDSMFSILTGRSIRLSDTMRLNDKNEIRIYHSMLNEVLDWYKTASDYSVYKPLIEKVRTNIRSFLKKECYILSFSNLCDSLDQWFKYGDYCRGVCLGMEQGDWGPPTGLCKVLEDGADSIKKKKGFKPDKRDYGVLNGNLEYSETVVKNNVRKLMQTVLEKYADFRNQNASGTVDSFVSQEIDFFNTTCKRILFRLMTLKDSSFESEKEQRFFWWLRPRDAEAIRNRKSSRGQYGHYIDIPFDRLPLKEIWVGPMAPKDTEFYVNKLLIECGYKDVKVTRSVIPLNI